MVVDTCHQLALHFLLLFHLLLQLHTRLDRVLSLPAVLNITHLFRPAFSMLLSTGRLYKENTTPFGTPARSRLQALCLPLKAAALARQAQEGVRNEVALTSWM